MTIRVLRVIARMNVGGPAVQVTTLSVGMQPPAFEQRLLTGTVESGEADFLALRAPQVDRVVVDGLGRAPRWRDDVRALVGIIQEIRRYRPDVVHTHTAKAGVLGRLAAIVCRVPVRVHTFHGHLLRGYFGAFGTSVVVTMERLFARGTTVLVAVGAQVRDELLEAHIGRPDQYRVVPPGLTLKSPPSRDDARKLLNLAPDRPVVSFVGRLTAVKRPDRFLETCRLVHGTHPDACFLVVGEGDLYDEVQAQAATLGDAIRFLGWRDDIETIYAASDVVLLTSDNEGMPVSLIEAAMAGCPAVTTAVGSAAEVVLDGRTGFVCLLDARELAAAVQQLLDDPGLRQTFGTAAAEWAQERFSSQRLIDDMAEIYRSAVNEGGHPRR